MAVALARRRRACLDGGALRHKQLHAGRSDRAEVFLPGQGLPRIERLQR